MWIRAGFLFITGISLVLGGTARAVGPFHPECEEAELRTKKTLSELQLCLEKDASKRQLRKKIKSSNTCTQENDTHLSALADLKACLAGPSPKSK